MPINESQLVNKQHAVPQNIMDVEFKLIGDLTMRQFAYLLVFGGIAYGCFSLLEGIFKWPFVTVFSLMGLGLAFFTIGDRGMDQWVVNFFKSMYSPSQKVWKKDPIVPSIFMYQNLAVVKHELITLAPTSSRRKLEEYLEYQGKTTKVDRLDIPEQEYITKVREAFANDVLYAPVDVAAPTTVSAPVQEYISPVIPSIPPVTITEPRSSTPNVSNGPQPQEVTQKQAPAISQTQPAVQAPANVVPQRPTVSVPQAPVAKPSLTVSAPRPQLNIHKKHGEYVPLSPITPDRRTGRIFTSLLPEQGEIVLPIRGEKVLKTSEQEYIQDDIDAKAEQLRKLINQIKTDETYKQVIKDTAPKGAKPNIPSVAQPQQFTPVPVAPKPETKVKEEATNILEAVKSENQRLTQEIDRLKQEISRSQQEGLDKLQKQQQLQKLQQEKEHVSADVQTLQSTVTALQQKAYLSDVKATPPTYAKMQPISTKPNVISGVVKNATNNALEGVVIVIKDAKGEPKRALKTNTLGQFSISTPLVNGKYIVEVDSSNKSGLIFDIISVDAKGEVIPPIEFVGRISNK